MRRDAQAKLVPKAQVSWTRPDGSRVDSEALSLAHAEALAKAFAVYWPEGQYVVKPEATTQDQ